METKGKPVVMVEENSIQLASKIRLKFEHSNSFSSLHSHCMIFFSVISGTDIEEFPLHPRLHISQLNTCQRSLRQDLELDEINYGIYIALCFLQKKKIVQLTLHGDIATTSFRLEVLHRDVSSS